MKTATLLPALALALALHSTAGDYQAHETLIFRSGSDEKADQHGVRQYRIPHVTTGPHGEIVACVAGRTNKAGDNGRTTSVFAVSRDRGKSWEHIRFESDYSKPTPDGAFPMSSRTNEVQVEWFPAIKQYVAIFADQGKCHQIRSKDLKTWSKPQLLPHQEKLSKSWPSPTSIRVEEDGSLCFNLIVVPMDKPFDERSVQMFWTKDGTDFETSPPAPFSTGECNAAHLGDGRYLLVARTRERKKNRLIFSYNRNKKEWSSCGSLTVPTWYSCEQDLLAHDGNLYLSVPTGNGRLKGCIYISEDQGETWRVFHQLKEQDYFGYSSITILPDGTMGLVSERKNDPKQLLDIVFTPVPME